MPRPRNEGLRRTLCLLRRVESLRYAPPVKSLAREFGVTTRTIRRDLALLEEVGYRVPPREGPA